MTALKTVLLLFAFAFISGTLWLIYSNRSISILPKSSRPKISFSNLLIPASPSPSPLPSPPISFVIPIRTHVFQTFNNCGPAAFSMQLSYFDMNVNQQELGNQLRPYQIPRGDNDDKSVTLTELAQEATNRGLISYYRPNGHVELLKQFISQGLPVVIRTWLRENEDIGHYRLIRGYDDTTQEFVQDDSLQNKNLRYSYSSLQNLWQAFSYEYLVIAPPDKTAIVERILGSEVDPKIAWTNTRSRIQKELQTDPDNMYLWFNLSVAAYNLGDYQESAAAFEKVESRLPFRMLWYQIEPIQAYFYLNNYTRVFELTDKILNNHNRAFSELYDLRGQIYLKQGDIEAAKSEFEKAKFYNQYFRTSHPELVD